MNNEATADAPWDNMSANQQHVSQLTRGAFSRESSFRESAFFCGLFWAILVVFASLRIYLQTGGGAMLAW